ncbi:polypyrimidine tract-binding protein homolog 3 [Tanacetum coccineum]
MASGCIDQNAEYALSKLLQMGMVAEYESEFVIHANRVACISANLLKSFHIFGLKLELQRELFRSRPTTLGEAFSFARIVEVRFEDERSTIAIAKPNELTTHVHVQDLEQTTRARGDEPNRILLKSAHVQALIQFRSRQNAVVARNSLQGCNIYEGCCQLYIQFSNLEELQENQEEHICYYYQENCFSILNIKEAGNTKSPLSADTFGNNGVDESETSGPETPAKEVVDNFNGFALIRLVGYGTGSEMVTSLPKEFQEGDMVDVLSRAEQKSSKNWKELDNESEVKKVERDAEREGEPTILATFCSDRGITIWDP